MKSKNSEKDLKEEYLLLRAVKSRKLYSGMPGLLMYSLTGL